MDYLLAHAKEDIWGSTLAAQLPIDKVYDFKHRKIKTPQLDKNGSYI